MRRHALLILAGLGIAAAGSFATWSAVTSPSWRMGTGSCGIAGIAAHGARALGALIVAGTGPANAEETLKFKPVPPESVTELETRRTRRSTTTETVPAPPDEPEPPEDPGPPSRSSRTEIVGKTGNVMRIGSDVHVERDQVIAGDLVVVGGDINVDGHVEGDVVALGGDIQLGSAARVDGDVACISGQLTEDPGAWVGGQRVTAMGSRGLRGVRGMRHLDGITGVRDHTEREVMRGVKAMGRVVTSLVWLFILVAVAWGYSQIAPGTTQSALNTLKRETALSLLVGALVWALIIPSIVALALVVAILCITIIGIPLGLAALFGYFVFLAVLWTWGFAVAAAGVGEWISNRRSPGMGGAAGLGPHASWSLTRKAVMGVLVLSGSGLFGHILQTFVFIPPLRGIGTFISVVSIVAGGLAATIGGGAWLRTQIVSGTLGRWWRGRGRPGAQAGAPIAPETPVAPASAVVPPVVAAPAAPFVAPPSPPEAFAPPPDPSQG